MVEFLGLLICIDWLGLYYLFEMRSHCKNPSPSVPCCWIAGVSYYVSLCTIYWFWGNSGKPTSILLLYFLLQSDRLLFEYKLVSYKRQSGKTSLQALWYISKDIHVQKGTVFQLFCLEEIKEDAYDGWVDRLRGSDTILRLHSSEYVTIFMSLLNLARFILS